MGEGKKETVTNSLQQGNYDSDMVWFNMKWKNSGKEVCISMKVGIKLSHDKWVKKEKKKVCPKR
jgi:hypothetical protein